MPSSFFAFFLGLLVLLHVVFLHAVALLHAVLLHGIARLRKAESDTVRRHIAINLGIILFMNFSPIHVRIDAEERGRIHGM